MFFIFLLATGLAIEINFHIKHKSNQCFGDTVPENMLVVGEVMGDTHTYSVRIYTPLKSQQLHYSENATIQHFSFMTEQITKMQICINNLARTDIQVAFKYATGADAFDYTLLANKEDVNELQQETKKLQDMLKGVKQTADLLITRQAESHDIIQYMSNKFLVLSAITIGLMILTTLAFAYGFKRYLKSRKYI